MDKVREYRHRAQECREQAASSTTDEVRQIYNELADMWIRIAEKRLRFFHSVGNAGEHRQRRSPTRLGSPVSTCAPSASAVTKGVALSGPLLAPHGEGTGEASAE
jgi:hypothetical protein